jgi:hypothetical protein
MSELGDLQRQFTYAKAQLVIYAYEVLGYELTEGEGYDDDNKGHMKGSTHYIRLAQDFNIFRDKIWLQGADGEDAHNQLHDKWDELGGSERIDGDLNHYSFEYNGRR